MVDLDQALSNEEIDRRLARYDLLPFCRATFIQSRTLHKRFLIPEEEASLDPEWMRYYGRDWRTDPDEGTQSARDASMFKLSEGDEDINMFQDPIHIQYLAKKLDWWIKTPGANLMIFTPPRHGKTELCLVRLVPFLMGRFQGAEVVGASYAQDLINSKSRQARTVCMTESYKEIFPDAWLNPVKNPFGYYAIGRGATQEWETPNGSIFKCSGIGAGLTGRGFHFGIIDDPSKGRKEAESITVRNSDWDWYTTVFCTRAMPGARKLLIMTRWHIDDLAGRILKAMQQGEGEEWEMVNLRAIARADDDPLEREPGEALWAARYPLSKLKVLRGIEGAYNWAALYDGEPTPPGGELIDSSLFKIKGLAPDGLEWVRFVDPAVSTKTDANSTASIGMAMDEYENIYLRNLIYGQWNWPQARRIHLTTCKIEGPEVRYGMEDAGQQKALIDDIQHNRDFSPYSWAGYPVVANKKIRALPWIAKQEAGKVYLIVGKWNQKLLDVSQLFTGQGDEDDDIIDAISGAYQMLVGPGPKKRKFRAHVGSA